MTGYATQNERWLVDCGDTLNKNWRRESGKKGNFIHHNFFYATKRECKNQLFITFCQVHHHHHIRRKSSTAEHRQLLRRHLGNQLLPQKSILCVLRPSANCDHHQVIVPFVGVLSTLRLPVRVIAKLCKYKCIGQLIVFFREFRVGSIVKFDHNVEYSDAFLDFTLFLLHLVFWFKNN